MPNIPRERFEPITGDAAEAARAAGVITEGVKRNIDSLGLDEGEYLEDDSVITKEGDAIEKMIAKHSEE